MRIRSLVVRFLVTTALFALVALPASAVILRSPHALFGKPVTVGQMRLYCDRPFFEKSASTILKVVGTRLARSPLYSADDTYEIFVCNTTWPKRLFFNVRSEAASLSYYPVTGNVFVRDGLIDENRVLAPTGERLIDDRTLDYVIAHELTHLMVEQAIGWQRYTRLPQWIRDGYADYIAKGPGFDYEKARRAFLSDARDMDPAASGLYVRYQLLVAHYLEKEEWSISDLLATAIPQDAAEEVVRNEAQPRSQRANRKR